MKAKRDYRKENLRGRYGITKEQYDIMLKQQQGKCGICFGDGSAATRGLMIDHKHGTKIVRALLCSNCNTALGLLKESVSIMETAIKYLQKHNGNV